MDHFASLVADPHPRRVAELAGNLAVAVDVAAWHLPRLERGALLHDIGKELLPPGIIDKPAPLTDEERRVMQCHSTLGAELAACCDEAPPVVAVIRHHHERWDGGGYPYGLGGEAIPLLARIVCLADAFEAMTTDRPYRAALPHEVALAELEAHAGTQFDPRLVDAFIELLTAGQAGALSAA